MNLPCSDRESTCCWPLTNLTDRQTGGNSETQGLYEERPAACLDLYRSTRSTIATMTEATVAKRLSLKWVSTSPAADTVLVAAPLPPPGAGGKEKEGEVDHLHQSSSLWQESPTTSLTPTQIHLHHPCEISSLTLHWDRLSLTPSNHLTPPWVFVHLDQPSNTPEDWKQLWVLHEAPCMQPERYPLCSYACWLCFTCNTVTYQRGLLEVLSLLEEWQPTLCFSRSLCYIHLVHTINVLETH